MKMNDSGNIFTQFFAWVAALASAIGFTTQDLVFMFFGAAGLLISLASYINGRVTALTSIWHRVMAQPLLSPGRRTPKIW